MEKIKGMQRKRTEEYSDAGKGREAARIGLEDRLRWLEEQVKTIKDEMNRKAWSGWIR